MPAIRLLTVPAETHATVCKTTLSCYALYQQDPTSVPWRSWLDNLIRVLKRAKTYPYDNELDWEDPVYDDAFFALAYAVPESLKGMLKSLATQLLRALEWEVFAGQIHPALSGKGRSWLCGYVLNSLSTIEYRLVQLEEPASLIAHLFKGQSIDEAKAEDLVRRMFCLDVLRASAVADESMCRYGYPDGGTPDEFKDRWCVVMCTLIEAFNPQAPTSVLAPDFLTPGENETASSYIEKCMGLLKRSAIAVELPEMESGREMC